MKILVFLIVAYSMTQIIVESTLFRPIRSLFSKPITKPLSVLIHCFMCTGAWIGFLLAIYWYSPILDIFECPIIIYGKDCTFFFDGMLTSAIVWEMRIVEGVLDSIRKRLNRDGDV